MEEHKKSVSPLGIKVEVFGLTDRGRVREVNEDAFLVADLSRHLSDLTTDLRTHTLSRAGTIFIVCDGMGGALAGEVASKMAIETLLEIMEREPFPTTHDWLVRRMDTAMKEASERIFIASRRDITKRGMGTTITIAAAIDERLFVGQVGDSRCYLLRLDTIYRLTKDQSLVNQLIEAGQLREDEIKNFEYSNVILQAAGTQRHVKPEFTYVDLRDGDTILLCSDGLHSMVGDDAIAYTLLHAGSIESACYQLVELANKQGGNDNITVVVARFAGPGLAKPDDSPILYQRYILPRQPEPMLLVDDGEEFPEVVVDLEVDEENKKENTHRCR